MHACESLVSCLLSLHALSLCLFQSFKSGGGILCCRTMKAEAYILYMLWWDDVRTASPKYPWPTAEGLGGCPFISASYWHVR